MLLIDRLVFAEDVKELMYVKCIGQDKAFIEAMEEVIDNVPTVQAKVIEYAEWVKDEKESNRHIENIYYCSKCKNQEVWESMRERHFALIVVEK